MNREDLAAAKEGADLPEDKLRLDDGYWALRICTTNDLEDIGVREAEGRRKPLANSIRSLESLGGLTTELAAELAANTLAELRRRLVVYDEWIRTHQPQPPPAPEKLAEEREKNGRLQQDHGAGEEAAADPGDL